MRRTPRRALATVAALALALFTGAGVAITASADTGAPWVASDQPDYVAGATVTLTGGNWAPDESVHLVVNDDAGATWSYSVDVVADADGVIGASFNLPSWFVASYGVMATGSGGEIATTSFTDSNVNTQIGNLAASPNPVTVGSATAVSGDLQKQGNGNAIAISGFTISVARFASQSNCDNNSSPTAIGSTTTTSAGHFTLAYTPSSSGTQYIRASFAGAPSGVDVYSSASACTTLSVSAKTAQTISFTSTAPASAVYHDQYTPTATATSGLSVTFGASGVCSWDGTKVTMDSVGNCTVTADQPGNATFAAAPQVTQVFAVGKAAQASLSVTGPVSATFGAADATITTSGGSGTGAVSFDVGASTGCSIVSGALHVDGASGTCSVTATKAGDANFNSVSSSAFAVTLNKGTQATLSITGPSAATFGDADATITTTGGSGSGAVTFDSGASTACSIVSGKLRVTSGTGTCSVTATKAGDSNYNSTVSSAFPVVINKAGQVALSITGPGSATFGDVDATITTTGGSGSGAVTFDSGASTACSIVGGKLHVVSGTGTCALTATKAGDNDYNAGATSDVFAVTINKAAQTALTITGPTSATYGDPDATITTTGGSGSGAVTFDSGTSTACSIVGGKLHVVSGTGTCVLTATKAGDNDYNAGAASDAFTVTINKATQATLTVTGPSNGQYSDVYAPTTSGGSGDGQITFSVVSGPCAIPASGTDANKVKITAGSGSCIIKATKAADNNYASTTSANYTITAGNEDAVANFATTNPAALQVTTAGGSYTGGLVLSVSVREKSPDQATTGRAGDVTMARLGVVLSPVSGGGSIPMTCPTSGSLTRPGSSPDYADYVTFVCTITSGTSIPVDTYEVDATVNGGYYAGSGADTFTVYDPSLGFATGGGWFLLGGDKVNFGFTMKYGKNGSNLKGSFMAVRHFPDGTVARLKSNSLTSGGLALQNVGGYGTASFSGKATYTDRVGVTTGNNAFTVFAKDGNDPGSGLDSIWVGGAGDVSSPGTASTAGSSATVLGGGNIAVPHTPAR